MGAWKQCALRGAQVNLNFVFLSFNQLFPLLKKQGNVHYVSVEDAVSVVLVHFSQLYITFLKKESYLHVSIIIINLTHVFINSIIKDEILTNFCSRFFHFCAFVL